MGGHKHKHDHDHDKGCGDAKKGGCLKCNDAYGIKSVEEIVEVVAAEGTEEIDADNLEEIVDATPKKEIYVPSIVNDGGDLNVPEPVEYDSLAHHDTFGGGEPEPEQFMSEAKRKEHGLKPAPFALAKPTTMDFSSNVGLAKPTTMDFSSNVALAKPMTMDFSSNVGLAKPMTMDFSSSAALAKPATMDISTPSAGLAKPSSIDVSAPVKTQPATIERVSLTSKAEKKEEKDTGFFSKLRNLF